MVQKWSLTDRSSLNGYPFLPFAVYIFGGLVLYSPILYLANHSLSQNMKSKAESVLVYCPKCKQMIRVASGKERIFHCPGCSDNSA